MLLLSLTVLAASCSRVVSPGTSNASTDIGSLPRRGLTPGERAMIAPIFGDSIDYDTVRIIHARHPFQASNMYMAPRGHIYAPGDLWHDDWAGFGVSAVARAEFAVDGPPLLPRPAGDAEGDAARGEDPLFARVAVPGSLDDVEAVLVTDEPLGGATVPSKAPVITAQPA